MASLYEQFKYQQTTRCVVISFYKIEQWTWGCFEFRVYFAGKKMFHYKHVKQQKWLHDMPKSKWVLLGMIRYVSRVLVVFILGILHTAQKRGPQFCKFVYVHPSYPPKIQSLSSLSLFTNLAIITLKSTNTS